MMRIGPTWNMKKGRRTWGNEYPVDMRPNWNTGWTRTWKPEDKGELVVSAKMKGQAWMVQAERCIPQDLTAASRN